MTFFRKLFFLVVIIFCLKSYISLSQIIDIEYKYGTQQVYEAQKLLDEDLLKLSEKMIKEAIQNFPQLTTKLKAILLQSKIEFYDGRTDYAIKVLKNYISDNPNSLDLPYAYEFVAYYFFESKDYNESDRYFNLAIETANKEFSIRRDSSYLDLLARIFYFDGIALLRLGKVDKAKEPLEKCFRRFPKNFYADESLFLLGIISELKGEIENAINYFKTLQRNYPRSNLILASILREVINYLTLKQDIQALVSLDLARSILSRINAKDSIGLLYEPQNYVDDIDEKIDFLTGEALTIAGRYEQAISIFDDFIRKYPNSKYTIDAEIGTAWSLLNKGDLLRSIEEFKKIIETVDAQNNFQRNFAELYLAIANRKLGRYSEAQKILSDLSIRPDFPFIGLVLLEQGLINYQKKDFQKALKSFERGLRESDDIILSAKLHLMLGATYLELKEWSKAIKEYKNAEDIARRSTNIQLPNRNWIISECRLKQSIAQIYDFRNLEAIQNLLFFLGNYSDDPRAVDATFWLAEAYFRSDMLRNAIDKYETLLAKYPQNPFFEDALYGLGWSYFRLKNFKKSTEIFSKLIKEYPDSKYRVEVWLRQGDGYFVLKDFRNAIESYRKVVTLNPNSEEVQYAQYQICHSLYRLGNLNSAYDEVIDFIKKFPNSSFAPNAMYLGGWVRFQQGNYSEAINSFNYLIDAFPNSLLVPRAKFAIADALYNQNKFEEAVEKYKEIIENYPTSPLVPDALRGIQYCYVALGNPQAGINYADDYIARNPESPFAAEFAIKKGESLFATRNYKDAITEFNSFIQKFPENPKKVEAIFWMAKSYSSLGDFENAVKYFNELITKYQNIEYSPQAMLELGLLYKNQSNISLADSFFTRLQYEYPDDPSSAQAGFELASIKFNTGDTSSALSIWEKISNNFTGSEFADQSTYKIAMYYRHSGRLDSAISKFRKLAENSSDPRLTAESIFRIGEIYLRRNDCDRAINEFIRLRDNFSGIEDWYTLGLLNLGECYEKQGNLEEAINSYRAIVSSRPSDEFVATAKRRMDLLEKGIKR
ncbi:MAG: tetratricopeptide repeat protein [Candidatus Kapaibacteriales bacterium]